MNVFGRILIVGFIGLLGFSSKAIAQGAPALNLTLDAAIQRALERNLNIAVERINPQVVDLTLVEQQAVYRPTVGFNVDNRSQTYPASTQLGGGDVTETDTRTFDVSLGQPVPWGGGNLDVGLNSLRYETTNFFTSFNPSFRSVVDATYTQSLLQNFRIDPNRAQIQVARINRTSPTLISAGPLRTPSLGSPSDARDQKEVDPETWTAA